MQISLWEGQHHQAAFSLEFPDLDANSELLPEGFQSLTSLPEDIDQPINVDPSHPVAWITHIYPANLAKEERWHARNNRATLYQPNTDEIQVADLVRCFCRIGRCRIVRDLRSIRQEKLSTILAGLFSPARKWYGTGLLNKIKLKS